VGGYDRTVDQIHFNRKAGIVLVLKEKFDLTRLIRLQNIIKRGDLQINVLGNDTRGEGPDPTTGRSPTT
jgi:hypothetical protein